MVSAIFDNKPVIVDRSAIPMETTVGAD